MDRREEGQKSCREILFNTERTLRELRHETRDSKVERRRRKSLQKEAKRRLDDDVHRMQKKATKLNEALGISGTSP